MVEQTELQSMSTTVQFNLEGPIATSIQQKITQQFNPLHLEIINQSHKHAGHAEIKGKASGTSTETHFKVVVVSDAFDKQLPIDRHRSINDLLDDEFKQGLHALSIEAKTPKQWEIKQQQTQNKIND